MQVSPFQAVGKTIGWSLSFIILIVLYFILFALGGRLVAPYLPRPLLNSVHMSHLIETASSTFVFGLIVTWLLYSEYKKKKS